MRFALRAAGYLLIVVTASSCRRDGRTPLVLYSPHGRDLLGLVEKEFEAAHPDIDVRWLDMGSQEVYDRLRSEKANPQADVWYGGPDTIFARGARDGLLAAYRPTWAEHVAPESRHPGDLYFGLYRTPAMPVYNDRLVKAEDAPREWDDLLDPKWKGKILIRDPLASGTMRAVWGFVLSRSVRETGSPDAGFAWLARLDAQTKEYVFNPILMYEKLIRGEGLLTIWDLPDTLLERQRGSPLQYVFPRSGTPVIDDADRPRRRRPPRRRGAPLHRVRRREAAPGPGRGEDLPPPGPDRPRRRAAGVGARRRANDGARRNGLGADRPRRLGLDVEVGPDGPG